MLAEMPKVVSVWAVGIMIDQKVSSFKSKDHPPVAMCSAGSSVYSSESIQER